MDRGTRVVRTTTTGVAVVLVALVAAGCAAPGTAPPRPVAVVVDGAPDCTTSTDAWLVPEAGAEPTSPPPPEAGSVPDDFEPVSAVRCDGTTDTVDDAEGRWSARVETTWTDDLAPLLAALAVPDETSSGIVACTADMELVPDLWLADAAGRSLRVAWPRDVCGKTVPGTQEALGSLPVASERLVRVSLAETRAALDAGCATRASLPWALKAGIVTDLVVPDDGVSDDGVSDPGGGTTTGPAVPAQPLAPPLLPDPDALDRACVYAVDPPVEPAAGSSAPEGEGEGVAGGSAAAASPPGGTFVRVVELPDGLGARLVTAATTPSTPELEACGTAASAFVTFPDTAPGATVTSDPRLTAELDGCGRLLTSDGGARPFPEELAAPLRD